MKTSLRLALSATLALSAGLFAGCSTVDLDQTGDTQAVYKVGYLEVLVNSNAPTAYNATLKALQNLNLYQTRSQLNTFDGWIDARDRDDTKISIVITETNSRQTLVKIRWGAVGNKDNSLQLYQQIEKNLGGS